MRGVISLRDSSAIGDSVVSDMSGLSSRDVRVWGRNRFQNLKGTLLTSKYGGLIPSWVEITVVWPILRKDRRTFWGSQKKCAEIIV